MINDRIEELINKFCKGNSSLFSRKIGVRPSVVSNMTGQRRGKPSFDVINNIVSAFEEINARWLITGEGEMLDNNLSKDTINGNNIISKSNNSSIQTNKDIPMEEFNRHLLNELVELREENKKLLELLLKQTK